MRGVCCSKLLKASQIELQVLEAIYIAGVILKCTSSIIILKWLFGCHNELYLGKFQIPIKIS